ncbi:MAG: Xaa-Pro peptidase family protein [candidate division KSB1 bacterium]|nr:Xaa-Pro peptidase family protein [candidate division KSB1 bacterium]MDZ7302146.1 Xaa-Pro peptidase family protein [candidate division KSB1 bacterium]MDZ7311256.1 Xaa-Pro peptidase family protein [candidate division KSB1 bacterium]
MSKPAFPGLLIDISEVQKALVAENLDGWLIYDFHGINAVARALFVFEGHLVTRRWFYFIPAAGEPVLLAHKIEETSFPPLPGQARYYAGWQELHQRLRELLKSTGKPNPRLAMEYSPMNDVPTVSYVDAGMLELIRSFGVEVISSANLIQLFQARWSAEQLASHIAAAEALYAIQQEAFKKIEAALQAGQPITEYEVQQFIRQKIHEAGCVIEDDPIVAVNNNASNPHYAPTAQVFSPIKRGDVILIDLWAKKASPRAVYADITWMGYAGEKVPDKVQQVFQTVLAARDRGVNFLREQAAAGKVVPGYLVDEVVRGHIAAAGYGSYFFHRTGHSLGTEIHANGVNMDSYETRDSRHIIPGLAFSIEPGIYLPEFGMRSEIDVYFGEKGPEIYTQPQTELVKLKV